MRAGNCVCKNVVCNHDFLFTSSLLQLILPPPMFHSFTSSLLCLVFVVYWCVTFIVDFCLPPLCMSSFAPKSLSLGLVGKFYWRSNFNHLRTLLIASFSSLKAWSIQILGRTKMKWIDRFRKERLSSLTQTQRSRSAFSKTQILTNKHWICLPLLHPSRLKTDDTGVIVLLFSVTLEEIESSTWPNRLILTYSSTSLAPSQLSPELR